MNELSLFERTAAGWQEIKCKSHGLTQSERLVLILIDGKSTAGEVRTKAPSLKPLRFEAAIKKLCEMGLIIEQLLKPDESAVLMEWPEPPTPDEVQRFLEQDKLDPVSVVLQDFAEEVVDEGLAPSSPLRPISAPKDFLPDLKTPTLPPSNLIDDLGRSVKSTAEKSEVVPVGVLNQYSSVKASEKDALDLLGRGNYSSEAVEDGESIEQMRFYRPGFLHGFFVGLLLGVAGLSITLWLFGFLK